VTPRFWMIINTKLAQLYPSLAIQSKMLCQGQKRGIPSVLYINSLSAFD
jgi:hypothetical protein